MEVRKDEISKMAFVDHRFFRKLVLRVMPYINYRLYVLSFSMFWPILCLPLVVAVRAKSKRKKTETFI